MLAVANYHYIRQDFSAEYQSIFGLTPIQFEEQLKVLSKEGEFISQDQLLEIKEKPFTKNRILITFDDGLKEQFVLAKPILDRLGIPFIFFINTSNYIEKKVSLVHKIHLLRSKVPASKLLQAVQITYKKVLSQGDIKRAIEHYNYDDKETAKLKYLLNFMLTFLEQEKVIDPLFQQFFNETEIAANLYFSEDMLQTLFENGNLGSHAHNHVPLGKLPINELELELKNTQDFFLKKFSKHASILSYPYGSFEASSGVSESLEKYNFKLAFTMERAVNNNLQTAPYLLSRYDCNDLPLGKSNLFKTKPIFEKPHLRNWYKNETSFTNKH